MTDGQFYRWLMEQSQRADAVGDVARYARENAAWPRGTDDVDTLVAHLDAMHADDKLHAALRHAWRSWSVGERRGQASGGFADFE